MSHVIEIVSKNRSLSEELGQMRTWLDHMGYVPVAFRSIDCRDGLKFRVEFAIATEAEAFARAFGGRPCAAPEKTITSVE